MGFHLDHTSQTKLLGVHPDLVRVVNNCAENFSSDRYLFGVVQGLRTPAEQLVALKSGKSTTMHSRHLPQKAFATPEYPQGLACAVDLAILLPGQLGEPPTITWNTPLYLSLPVEMKMAAEACGMADKMNWGGCWDRTLDQLSGDMEMETAQYVLRARKAGGRGFQDFPHFQASWSAYPSKN